MHFSHDFALDRTFPARRIALSWLLAVVLLFPAFMRGEEPNGQAKPVGGTPGWALEDGFRWLFDGKDFSRDWEGNTEWFRVEDGTVVAGSLERSVPRNEFLCTRERFRDFELRLEVRLRGQGKNAGVQFRTARLPGHHEVSGYQADVGVAFQRSVWGALYDESRRKKMLAEGPAEKVNAWTKEGDWNALWISAVGPRIRIWLNGHQTVDYTEKDEAIADEGIIGLQIHSGPPTEALYRNIRVRVLESRP